MDAEVFPSKDLYACCLTPLTAWASSSPVARVLWVNSDSVRTVNQDHVHREIPAPPTASLSSAWWGIPQRNQDDAATSCERRSGFR